MKTTANPVVAIKVAKLGHVEIASVLEGTDMAVYGTVAQFVAENGEYMTDDCWRTLLRIASGRYTGGEVGPFQVWR